MYYFYEHFFTGSVKLSNYSIHRRLSDLNIVTHSNYSKKTDIFKFALFILSLVEGRSFTDDSVEIPNSIQSDLFDLLTK